MPVFHGISYMPTNLQNCTQWQSCAVGYTLNIVEETQWSGVLLVMQNPHFQHSIFKHIVEQKNRSPAVWQYESCRCVQCVPVCRMHLGLSLVRIIVDELLVKNSTIFVDSTIFYNICRFTYIQKLQYSSVEGSRGWQGNCQVDTSSHRRNHHYRHNTICCWCYMMVWGSQKVVVHGGAGGQRVYILCNGCSDNARPS